MGNSPVQGDPLLGGCWRVPIKPTSCPTAPPGTLNPITELAHHRSGGREARLEISEGQHHRGGPEGAMQGWMPKMKP